MLFIPDMSTPNEPLDANLLLALDVLLAERSVTRAAERLHVTQSAMSHKLRQLRAQLGDELLVRGRSGLVLTERAEAIAGPLRQAVLDLRGAVHVGAPFDPATARRRFVLSASDYGELVAIPALLAHLGRIAPGVDMVIEPPAPDLFARLEAGNIDIAIAPLLDAPTGILRRKFFAEGFLVALRAGHPHARKRLDLDGYLTLSHLLVTPRGRGTGPVDEALAAQGLSRRVALRAPSFAAAPFIAAQTDLALTAPEGLLRAAARHAPLRLHPPPLALPQVPIFFYWHERMDRDPAHRWLRGLQDIMARAARGEPLDAAAPPPGPRRPGRRRARAQ